MVSIPDSIKPETLIDWVIKGTGVYRNDKAGCFEAWAFNAKINEAVLLDYLPYSIADKISTARSDWERTVWRRFFASLAEK